MNAPTAITIRPITPADADAFRALRLEALRRHPIAFTADLAEAEARPLEAWREQAARSTGDATPDLIVLAQTPAGDLAGMAGVYTPKQPKLAHSGTVWGVYVREPHRGQRVGDRLVRACVDWARAAGLIALKRSVVQGNTAAQRCYERCGFTVYGIEPLAVRWEGKLFDETLMAIRL